MRNYDGCKTTYYRTGGKLHGGLLRDAVESCGKFYHKRSGPRMIGEILIFRSLRPNVVHAAITGVIIAHTENRRGTAARTDALYERGPYEK